MSGGAEMIAGAVVQHVADMLGNMASEKIELLWKFKGDVEDMKDKMVTLEVVLSHADKSSQETDGTLVRHWLKKYKSIAYDIEDTLDELKTNKMIWKNSRCKVKLFFSSINPLVVRITSSSKMRNIKVKIDKIASEQNIQHLPLPSPTGQGSVKWRQTFIGNRDEIEMVGREREKKNIIKVLQKYDDQKNIIIPIVGLGGMGKTTIAKFVYTVKETNLFDLKAWVHVSMNFELGKIVADIISQVKGITPANTASLQNLKSELDQVLCGKLYLVVLDDVWEQGTSNLEALMNMLESGKRGSKIIVTTRIDKVASTLFTLRPSYFHTVEPVKLEGLSVDECWCIMKPPDLENGQLNDLIDIGKEIAQRCSGVPLVAKALGYVMQKCCTKQAWQEIRDTSILEINDDDSGILKGLMLSYHHMPPHLKLCFMYFSIFPKSHDIDHDCLIQQWIALGFIQDTKKKPLQMIGTEYLDEFLQMSFLTILTSTTVPSSRIFKPTFRLRMHDMLHDLARHIAGDEFSYIYDAANSYAEKDKLNCHYQLLKNQSDAPSTYKAFPSKVRAQHFRGSDRMNLPKKAFSNTLCLRVLDLSGCHMSYLPSSISKLKLLRYLDVSSLPISNLPKSLTYLRNLQALILSETSLRSLPPNIGCLQKLQYLDLSRCGKIKELPTSLADLSELLFLNLTGCHEIHTLPESFGKLHRLQFLNISDCYKIHSLPESCCQLHNLTHFDLSDCHNLEKLPDCIDQLSKLEYLNISCSNIQGLPESLCKLVNLKHLNLSFCAKLEHLPDVSDLNLDSFEIQGCLHLMRSNLGFISSFPEDLGSNVSGRYVLDGGSDNLWSQIGQLERTQCHELIIEFPNNVRQLEEADQARLSNNLKLTRLHLEWRTSPVETYDDSDSSNENTHAGAPADKSVLEKLVPPRSLQHLSISGYIDVDFPSWTLDISFYLPHLTTIFLFCLEQCNSLPPLGRLPNLRALYMVNMPNLKSITREFYGDYGTCQKLRLIMLVSLENLEEWWTTRSCIEDKEFLIPNLHLLWVQDCPNLKFQPYPPRSVNWVVENSDEVLPKQGFGRLTSTSSPYALVIKESKFPSEVFDGIQYFPTLERLDLESITDLTILPEAIQCLTCLQGLTIKRCYHLEALPEWLGDLTSLREIVIKSCPRLSSLPESIRRLTELKKLWIYDCPTLSQRCQGEDQYKIAHIPERQFKRTKSFRAFDFVCSCLGSIDHTQD